MTVSGLTMTSAVRHPDGPYGETLNDCQAIGQTGQGEALRSKSDESGEQLLSIAGHVSQPQKHSETFPHVSEDFDGNGCGELDAPSVPVQILDVIG